MSIKIVSRNGSISSDNGHKYSLLSIPYQNQRNIDTQGGVLYSDEMDFFTLVKEPRKKASLNKKSREQQQQPQRIPRKRTTHYYSEEEKLQSMKETFQYNKDMNRNMLLGLTAAFAAVTFAATSDFGLDNNVDKTLRDSITSILTVILVAILVIIVPLLHAYNMYEYGKLTGAPVNWWWYIFPLLLLLIGIIPIITYIVLLFT